MTDKQCVAIMAAILCARERCGAELGVQLAKEIWAKTK